MALPNEPINRKEMYLSAIAGENTQIPETPVTREEMYLDYIARNGGGSGAVDAYTKTETDALLSDKVDKETGKGLSTNNFTTVEKKQTCRA